MERKARIKRSYPSPPPVRHTKLSFQRLKRANPLLGFEEAGININGIPLPELAEKVYGKISLPPQKLTTTTTNFVRTQSLRLPKGTKKPTIVSNLQKQSSSSAHNPAPNNKAKPLKENLTITKPRRSLSADHKEKKKGSEVVSYEKLTITKPRRSLSAGHKEKMKGKFFNPQSAFTKHNTSQSEENLNLLGKMMGIPDFSPIPESSSLKAPSITKGRSLLSMKNPVSISSTPAAGGDRHNYLAKQLNDWLEKRGKRMSEFKHLNCFGIHSQKIKQSSPITEAFDENKSSPITEAFDEENKENIEGDRHNYLAKQLNDWLEKRGKRMSEFKHLNCFGIHSQKIKQSSPITEAFDENKSSPITEAFDEENKENIEGDRHNYLAKQLNDWLEKRGKRMSEFKHLNCFGIHSQKIKQSSPITEAFDENKSSPITEAFDEENKENIEVLNNRSESYELLKIDTTPKNDSPHLEKNGECSTRLPESNGYNLSRREERDTNLDVPKLTINGSVRDCVQSEEYLHAAAKDALKELQKIIEEGYPQDECMHWLELIREKHTELEEEPEYWECRAGIEKLSGNFGNAVECYKTAIVQGAEVKVIEESLDCLMKKFSVLDISPRIKGVEDKERKEKTKTDARNVFKSTIIQFAVETRKKKTSTENDKTQSMKKLQATPVRRSTRLSRSRYVLTPGVELWDSLKELPSDKYEFKTNKALVP